MNQPPQRPRPMPDWRRPPGVSSEAWEYVQQWSIADHYDDFVADTPLCRLDQQILRSWLPELSAGSSEVVLDLGCGTGRAAIPLAQRGYQVVAIDLSQAMLEQTRLQVSKLDHEAKAPGPYRIRDKVHPLRANLVQLECLGDAVADHAICLFSTLGMIQGHTHRNVLLRHCARAVRSGGTLVLHVHNRWAALREPNGITRLVRSWRDSLRQPDREFGDFVYPYRGLSNMFLHRFSRREICRELQDAGWYVEDLKRLTIDSSESTSSLKIPGGFIVRARRG